MIKMRPLLKKLVCIAATISLSVGILSGRLEIVAASNNQKGAYAVLEGPPIVLEIDALPTAPYSPGEMMDMGISSLDDLLPSSFASYPSYTSSQISQRADGKWVETATGTILNKWVSVDGKYRYYDAGVLQTNWKKLPVTNEPAAPERWFYFDANGDMFTGWMYISGSNTYLYLKPSTGIMAESEWVLIDGYWYYFDGQGYMQRNWITLNQKTYYLRPQTRTDAYTRKNAPDGSMVTGSDYLPSKDDNNKSRNYYFDSNGVMQNWNYPVPIQYVSLSSCFNDPRSSGNHQGIDINQCDGEIVEAAVDGTVYDSGYDSAEMGNYVRYTANVKDRTGNNLFLRHMHMQNNSIPGDIKKGAAVLEGQKLGLVGSTGNSSGPHLHFDISFDGTIFGVKVRNCVNPAAFFPNLTLLQGSLADVPPYGPEYNYAK